MQVKIDSDNIWTVDADFNPKRFSFSGIGERMREACAFEGKSLVPCHLEDVIDGNQFSEVVLEDGKGIDTGGGVLKMAVYVPIDDCVSLASLN